MDVVKNCGFHVELMGKRWGIYSKDMIRALKKKDDH